MGSGGTTEEGSSASPYDQRIAEHVRNATRGDQASLAWLMEEFDPLLMVQARFRLGERLARVCSPRDVVQETWVVALSKVEALRVEGRRADAVLRKFLTTTLRHIVNGMMRHHIRRRAGTGSPSPSPPSAARNDPMDRFEAMVTGASTLVARRELQDLLADAVDDLSEQEREIVVLRGIEQLSNEEVAATLHLEPGTTAVRFHRALKRLREKLPRELREWMPR